MSKPYRVVRGARQGSPGWHDFRRDHVGSSDAPVIAGESPYRSALELYTEKVDDGPPTVETVPVRFRIGHHMEGLILDMYEERTSRKLRRGRVLESRVNPWISASLDAETTEGRPVEAKWTTSSRWDDGLPSDVVIQATHLMAVTGAPVADVAVLRRDDLEIHEVPFDRDLWDALLRLDVDFRDHVVRRVPPPPDGSESARLALSRMFPVETAGMMDPDPETESVVRLILDGQERMKLLEGEVEGFRNTLRFILAEHAGVEGPGWKATYRKNRDSQAISWDLYAGSLEKVIGELLEDREMEGVDIEALRDIYTYTKTGPRVLRVTGGRKG